MNALRNTTVGRALQRWPGTFLTAVLALLWLAICPPTADLSAQLYRAHLFSAHGFSLWDNYWYGGHYLLGYSVLFPPLGALVGVKLLGAIAVVVTAYAGEWLIYDYFGADGRLAACWLAVGLASELISDRITFALGLAGFALAVALLNWELRHAKPKSGLRHPALVAAICAALFSALASPVAALFTGLVGVAVLLVGPTGRSSRKAGFAIAGAALIPALALSIAFPQGGQQPFTTQSLVPLLIAGVVLLYLVREQMLIYTIVLLYLIGCVAAAISTLPIGSNASRLGELLFGPLFVLTFDPRRVQWRWAMAVFVIAVLGLLRIQWQYTIDDLQQALTNGHSDAAYYMPLDRYLAQLPGAKRGAFRVEIPFTAQHWESYYVARDFPLARGWERQLDTAEDSIFYKHGKLTATSYRRWLDSLAVAYVAVSDAKPDYSAKAEIQLIDHGLPYLKLVAHLQHWRVYAVADPTPIVSGAASLTRLGNDSVTLNFPHPGGETIRVRYSPYWRLDGVSGCVIKSGGFVKVSAQTAGTATLKLDFALNRIGASSRRCN